MADNPPWLHGTVDDFKQLSGSKQIDVLNALLRVAHPSTLFSLYERVSHSDIMKRDFVSELEGVPLVCEGILGYLDLETLLSCRLVSHTWKKLVDQYPLPWRNACLQVGAAIDFNQPILTADEYISRVKTVCTIEDSVKKGSAFEGIELAAGSSPIQALAYADGKVATGSEDKRLRIWQDCNLLQEITSPISVSDLAIHGDRVYVASFDGRIFCWEITSGEYIYSFQGHINAILSIDVLAHVIATSSADSTVKLWSTNDHIHLLTIDLSDLKCNMLPRIKLCTSPQGQEGYMLAACNKAQCHKYIWHINDQHQLVSSHPYIYTVKDRTPYLPFCQLKPLWTPPRLMCGFSKHPMLVHQALLTTGERFSDGIYSCSGTVRCLIDSGCQYITALVENAQGILQLHIAKWSNHGLPSGLFQRLAVVSLPDHFCVTDRVCLVTPCDSSWMDGFDGKNNQGYVFTIATKNKVLVYRWKLAQ